MWVKHIESFFQMTTRLTLQLSQVVKDVPSDHGPTDRVSAKTHLAKGQRKVTLHRDLHTKLKSGQCPAKLTQQNR